jgi:hypothetical protein
LSWVFVTLLVLLFPRNSRNPEKTAVVFLTSFLGVAICSFSGGVKGAALAEGLCLALSSAFLCMALVRKGDDARWTFAFSLNPLVLIHGYGSAMMAALAFLTSAVFLLKTFDGVKNDKYGWGEIKNDDIAVWILRILPVCLLIFQKNAGGIGILILMAGVVARRFSWIVFSLSLCCHLAAGAVALSSSGVILVWSPFVLALAIEAAAGLARRIETRSASPVSGISVVIPAKNEADRIGDCILPMIGDPLVREVIVVDGGSSDGTAMEAEKLGAKVIVHTAPPENGGGRGGQIREGVLAACGDAVAVVHADTRIDPGVFGQISAVLDHHPSVIGGSAGSVFDDISLGMKVVEILNDMRAAFFGISFGDQIQFFRRMELADRDLYPGIPLMEDVELSLRLKTLGRTVHLFGSSVVSARRWREKGAGHALTVLVYFFSYLFQRLWKTPDSASIYRRYYGETNDRDSLDETVGQR